MKKSREIVCYSLLGMFFLLFFCCTSPSTIDPIIVKAEFLPTRELAISAQWHNVGKIELGMSPFPIFEQELKYHIMIRGSVFSSKKLYFIIESNIGYDPYIGAYYVKWETDNQDQYFASITDFQEYLRQPVFFTIPIESLEKISDTTLNIFVRGYVHQLHRDSIFKQWIRIFNSALYESYGELIGVNNG